MKAFIEGENFDPNSNEMKKLYIKDMYLGDYSYGLYSKLQTLLLICDGHDKSDLRIITNISTFINGIIYYTLGINTKDYSSEREIVSAIEEITGMQVNDWIENVLETKIAEAEKEVQKIRGE